MSPAAHYEERMAAYQRNMHMRLITMGVAGAGLGVMATNSLESFSNHNVVAGFISLAAAALFTATLIATPLLTPPAPRPPAGPSTKAGRVGFGHGK